MDETPDSPQAEQAQEAPQPETKPEPSRPSRAAPQRSSQRGVYYYDGTADTFHPVLGLIKVGENHWSDTDPEIQGALEAMVAKGILRQG